MAVHVLMNVLDDQEMRVALVRDGNLEALIHERTTPDAQHLGNIYKAKVANVEPSLDAAFIDLGGGKNGFIHVDDIDHGERDANTPIDKLLKPGQEILVQVTKEAIRDKGPCLTGFISLPGRCLVLVRDKGRSGGISKRIEDSCERERLRAAIKHLEIPEQFGLIVRTAAVTCSDDEIALDFEYLRRLWTEIEARAARVKAPACLYQEGDVILRTLRDLVPTDVESVVIDQEDLYDEARAFAQVFMPEISGAISLHRDELPVFSHYGIEERLASIVDNKVQLPSGGNIVIEQTEALISIDVNSSRNREGSDVAQTALRTNLEAVGGIVEQLMLRDLGGLVIIDFIDMENREHQRLVQLALRKALLRDKARTHVAPMSRFGLVEMTRQRTRPNHGLISHGRCPYCHGSGMVKTPETFEIECMRAIRRELASRNCQRLEVVVPTDMAIHLSNARRREIGRLEEESNCRIVLVGDTLMKSRDFRVSAQERRRGKRSRKVGDEPVRPGLLTPLLDQQAKAVAEAKALMQKKAAQLERELRAAEEGDETPDAKPKGTSKDRSASKPRTSSASTAPPSRPATAWEEARILQELLFS